MATVAELTAQLSALKKARSSGVQMVRHGDTQTVFKNDAEMAGAIAALERDIAQLAGTGVVRQIRISSCKGL